MSPLQLVTATLSTHVESAFKEDSQHQMQLLLEVMVKISFNLSSFCIIHCTVIVISVAVTESGDGAIAGQSYTLECGVSGAEVLADVSITYEWTRGSGSVVLGGDMTYTFTPTAGDDGVVYHCAATVTSSSLGAPITSSGSRTISVLGMH